MKKFNSGASLVEVLVTAILFALSVLAVLSLFFFCIYMSKRVDNEYAAVNIARNRIENLKAEEFTSLPQSVEDKSRVDAKGVSDQDGDFLRTTRVETAYGGDSNIAKVEVEVGYYVKGEEVPGTMKITTLFVNMD